MDRRLRALGADRDEPVNRADRERGSTRRSARPDERSLTGRPHDAALREHRLPPQVCRFHPGAEAHPVIGAPLHFRRHVPRIEGPGGRIDDNEVRVSPGINAPLQGKSPKWRAGRSESQGGHAGGRNRPVGHHAGVEGGEDRLETRNAGAVPEDVGIGLARERPRHVVGGHEIDLVRNDLLPQRHLLCGGANGRVLLQPGPQPQDVLLVEHEVLHARLGACPHSVLPVAPHVIESAREGAVNDMAANPGGTGDLEHGHVGDKLRERRRLAPCASGVLRRSRSNALVSRPTMYGSSL